MPQTMRLPNGETLGIPDGYSEDQVKALYRNAVQKQKMTVGQATLEGEAQTKYQKAYAAEGRAKEPPLFAQATGLLPIGGAMAGSLAASAGGPAGMMVGAGMGAAGGESLRRTANRLAGMKEEPSTGFEAARGVVHEAAGAVIGEALGFGIMGGVNKILGPNAAKMLKVENQEFVAAAKRLGIGEKVSAAEVTQSLPLRGIQKVSETSLLGRGYAFNIKRDVYATVLKSVDDSVSAFTGSGARYSELGAGQVIKDATEAAEKRFSATMAPAYAKLDDVANGRRIVDLSGVSDAVDKLKAETATIAKEFPRLHEMLKPAQIEVLEEEFGTKQIKSQVLTPGGKPYVTTTVRVGNRPQSFTDAHKLRSLVLELGRAADKAGKPKVERAAAIVSSEIDKAMEEAAKNEGGNVLNYWRSLNAAYKDGVTVLRGATMKALWRMDPDAVVRSIRPKNTQDVLDVMKVLSMSGDANAINVFRQKFTEHLIPDDLGKLGSRLDAMGPEVLDAVYSDPTGKAMLDRMKDVVTVARRVQLSAPSPTAAEPYSYWERMALVRGTVAAATGNALGVGRAGAEILTPAIFARVLRSDAATEYLTKGIAQVPTNRMNAAVNIYRAVKIATKTFKIAREASETTPPSLAPSH